MNVDELYPSKYLSAGDLQGKEPTVTITQITMEKMTDGQNKPCIFVNNRPKGIILNKTNAMAIASMYGKNTDAWIGKKIKLVKVWTDFQGKPVEAIRLVPPGIETMQERGMAAQAPANPPPAQPDDYGALMDDEIPF
jgi:hypothetical protein